MEYPLLVQKYTLLTSHDVRTCSHDFKIFFDQFRVRTKNKAITTRKIVQPIPLGVTFSKAQSSKLERLFCHVSVKTEVRALSVGASDIVKAESSGEDTRAAEGHVSGVRQAGFL